VKLTSTDSIRLPYRVSR